MSKSYFKGTDNVIIPFSKIVSTIDADNPSKLRVYTMPGTFITLGTKDAPRFLEEYIAWLDFQEQSLI